MMNHNKVRRAVAGLVLLGLVLRLALAVALGLKSAPAPGSDEHEYDVYAWNVAQGRGYRGLSMDVVDQDHLTAYRPPGPSLAWAACYAVFGHRYDVIRIMHCIVGAATIALVYGIGKRCFGEATGLLAAGIFTVWPLALLFSTQLISEPLGALLFMGFLLLCLRFGERPTWLLAIGAGVALGATILTRPNPMFMIPLIGVWAIWQFRRDRSAMVRGLAIPVIALMTMVPWWVRNYQVFHHFIPLSTMGGSSLLQGNNRIVATEPDLYGSSVFEYRIPEYKDPLRAVNNELERDNLARHFAVQWIKDNLSLMPRMALNKIVRGWTPFLRPHTARLYRLATAVSWGPVLVLFLIGFVPTLIGFLKSGHPGWVLHLGILSSLILTVILFGELRYRFVFEPICIVIASFVAVRALQFVAPNFGETLMESSLARAGSAAESKV
jgi:4-amino-4-deoxy-L-arabinose transferase-like glycosyltransferase